MENYGENTMFFELKVIELRFFVCYTYYIFTLKKGV